MTIEQVQEIIESAEFAGELSVASTLDSFLKGVGQSRVSVELSALLDKRVHREQILHRIYSLVAEAVDIRFENPRDTAIAVYLWVLHGKDPQIGRVAASAISKARQCWWSEKLAIEISKMERVEAANATVYYEAAGAIRGTLISSTSTSGEALMLSEIGGFTYSGVHGMVQLSTLWSIGTPKLATGSGQWFDSIGYRVSANSRNSEGAYSLAA